MTEELHFTSKQSSAVSNVLYNSEDETLFAEYRTTGDVYCYQGVDIETFNDFLNAVNKGHSIGEFINKIIKKYFYFTYVGNVLDKSFVDVFSD